MCECFHASAKCGRKADFRFLFSQKEKIDFLSRRKNKLPSVLWFLSRLSPLLCCNGFFSLVLIFVDLKFVMLDSNTVYRAQQLIGLQNGYSDV